jgi:hypothetical protein
MSNSSFGSFDRFHDYISKSLTNRRRDGKWRCVTRIAFVFAIDFPRKFFCQGIDRRQGGKWMIIIRALFSILLCRKRSVVVNHRIGDQIRYEWWEKQICSTILLMSKGHLHVDKLGNSHMLDDWWEQGLCPPIEIVSEGRFRNAKVDDDHWEMNERN